METKQCFSNGDSDVKDKPCSRQLSHCEIKSILISSFTQIGGLWSGNCVQSWMLTSVHWKWWWQCWNIAKIVPGGSRECSHRSRKNTVCQFVRTSWPNMREKVTISRTYHCQWWDMMIPALWAGIETAVLGVAAWIPHQRKGSRCSSLQVKWCALSSGVWKGWSFWISWNPDKPATLTVTSRH